MAKTQWGRKETIIWPPHSPIYTYGALFLAVILTGFFLYCRFSFGNTPLQRFYTPIYMRSTVAGMIGPTRQDKYRMLFVGRRGLPTRMGVEADGTEGNTPERRGKQLPLALSRRNSQSGYVFLFRGPELSYIDVPLSAYLRKSVFGGNSLN